MKRYRITHPGEHGQHVEEIWTETQIIENYYDDWAHKMTSIGKEEQISKENCIQDWITVNWAAEIEPLANNQSQAEEFLAELAKLLQKHNADISIDEREGDYGMTSFAIDITGGTPPQNWKVTIENCSWLDTNTITWAKNSKLPASASSGHGSFAEKPSN